MDINENEIIIRDLVAYGDTVNMTAVDLICNIDCMQNDPITNGARAIIIGHIGIITDSVIEDLLEYTSGDDTWND